MSNESLLIFRELCHVKLWTCKIRISYHVRIYQSNFVLCFLFIQKAICSTIDMLFTQNVVLLAFLVYSSKKKEIFCTVLPHYEEFSFKVRNNSNR